MIGEREGIHETSVDRPRVSYFGRGAGTEFADYRIARGNPDGMNEAVGGLFRPIADDEPYTGDRVIRTGYWGLAPLLAAVGVRDAVQVDGGDSLLFGRSTDVIVGGLMPEWKRMLQVWGVQFQPKM